MPPAANEVSSPRFDLIEKDFPLNLSGNEGHYTNAFLL